MFRPRRNRAFTLIELLVVVAIIALLISILLPTLSTARQQARAVLCLTQLKQFGTGLAVYVNVHNDVLPPGRLPRVDACNTFAEIEGGVKYRPTVLAMLSGSIGAPPFADPQACRDTLDRSGEPGDRQNYDYPAYVCPTRRDWTDERNASYGWNYQFLGNSRLVNDQIGVYKNWPVPLTRVRRPGLTVALADAMGTAAFYAVEDRLAYNNNSREKDELGNEGFNLDPPWVDPSDLGEMAATDKTARAAADPRHRGRANVLWVDGHADAQSLTDLGYAPDPNGAIDFGDEDRSDNTKWSITGENTPWRLTDP